MKTIEIAESSGFCFGVKRAIELAEKVAQENNNVYTFGPLIHNPQEVERLNKKGIYVINDYSKIQSGVLVLRTHGIELDVYNKLSQNKRGKSFPSIISHSRLLSDFVFFNNFVL